MYQSFIFPFSIYRQLSWGERQPQMHTFTVTFEPVNPMPYSFTSYDSKRETHWDLFSWAQGSCVFLELFTFSECILGWQSQQVDWITARLPAYHMLECLPQFCRMLLTTTSVGILSFPFSFPPFCSILQRPELLSEGQEGCPTDFFFQMEKI